MDNALQQKDSKKQFYFIFVGENPVFVPIPPPHFVQQSFLVYFLLGIKISLLSNMFTYVVTGEILIYIYIYIYIVDSSCYAIPP
jgi:hypothetical protein